jgi:hypothetical protein
MNEAQGRFSMKRIALFASLAALLVAPVLAQKPADKSAAAPAAASPAPQQEAGQPEAKKVAARKPSKRHEDARHCLDLSPNAKIIQCAERYL